LAKIKNFFIFEKRFAFGGWKDGMIINEFFDFESFVPLTPIQDFHSPSRGELFLCR
jgi:hypothetical protein